MGAHVSSNGNESTDASNVSNTTLASEEIAQSGDYKDSHLFSWFAHIITLKYLYFEKLK